MIFWTVANGVSEEAPMWKAELLLLLLLLLDYGEM